MKDFTLSIKVTYDRFGERSITMETLPEGQASVVEVQDVIRTLTDYVNHDDAS